MLIPARLGLWALLGLGASVPVRAQGPVHPGPVSDSPLQATTRLVQLNVVVHDRKGTPVSDLAKEDFTVLDHGKPQIIRLFSVETAGIREQGPKLLPGVYANQLSQLQGVSQAVTVLLLDALNTKLQDQAYARAQIIHLLEQLPPEYRVGIYTLGEHLRVLHEFTSDTTALMAELRKYHGEITSTDTVADPNSFVPTGADNPMSELPQIDAALREALQKENRFYTEARVRTTCRALTTIAHHLSRFPGRKNLIWVSGDFRLTMQGEVLSNEDECERAVQALNDANLAIYPVDARGLFGLSGIERADSRVSRIDPKQPGARLPQPLLANTDGRESLAQRTGGRAFSNTNDLAQAVRTAFEDSKLTYVLGYYPPDSRPDGRFHEVTVKVNRPGLTLHYRKGYFALPEEPPNEKQRQILLEESLWSPLESMGIGLVGGVNRPADQSGTARIVISVDPHTIRLNLQNDRWRGKLEVYYAVLDRTGALLSNQGGNLPLQLTQEQYQAMSEKGIVFTHDLSLPAAAAQIRVVVIDAATGVVGTLQMRGEGK